MHKSKAAFSREEKCFMAQKRTLRTSGLASHIADQESFKQLSKVVVHLKQNSQAAVLEGQKDADTQWL